MSAEEGGKMDGVAEESVDMVLEDIAGREGNRIEVQEYGLGRSGPLDRGSGSAPPIDGCNASGGLPLPLGRTEPLNRPSRDTGGRVNRTIRALDYARFVVLDYFARLNFFPNGLRFRTQRVEISSKTSFFFVKKYAVFESFSR